MAKESRTESARSKPRVGSIWYATKADPLLAMEPLLWLESPDGEVSVLEPVGRPGSPPPSAVEAVLGAAGFLTPPKGTVTLKSHEKYPGVVKHHGFEVPASSWGAAFAEISKLNGALGGWTTALTGQTAFHAPTHLAEILGVIWEKAGKPAWSVAHATSSVPEVGHDQPPVLTPFTGLDVRSRAIEERFGGLEVDASDGLTRQKTHFEVQDDVKLAPEKCHQCGGRLYEEEGHYFCANAAEESVQPDELVVE